MKKFLKSIFLLLLAIMFLGIIIAEYKDSPEVSEKKSVFKHSNSSISKYGYHKSRNGNVWVLFRYDSTVGEDDIFNFAKSGDMLYGSNATLYFYDSSQNIPWSGDVSHKLSHKQARERLISSSSGVWTYFLRITNGDKEFHNCKNVVNLYCKGRFKEQRNRMKGLGIKETDLTEYHKSAYPLIYKY